MVKLLSHRHDHDADHDDMGGLHRDLTATGSAMGRRDILRRLALGAGALALFGCRDATGATALDSDTGTGSAGACPTRIPTETAGPYPGDGSNGANVLNQTGVVRSDIRSSFAALSGSVTGVPLTIELTIVSASTCEPLAGYAVYLWHCDALGRYSLYLSGVTNQNWLRGVQAADANGVVTFTSIYPGCYSGRWPHIHFEVYRSVTAAQSVSNKIATSQIALPKATSDAVYATSGYTGSAGNLSRITLATDNVFSDGAALELATVTGNATDGYVASLTVAV
ncbi:MAG TPA: intradiol ring-cleavage dioxygenase [Gemmatimonadaceae bacterium]|nr:intradiol ring-cleavage dioxygenase [Gemmatimonadaceae bacterium]